MRSCSSVAGSTQICIRCNSKRLRMAEKAENNLREPHQRIGLLRITSWAFQYALGRWPEMVAVLASTLLGIGLSVLQPWPMKLLVDNVLKNQPLSPQVADFLRVSSGELPREKLLVWSVAGTVIMFLLNWAAGLIGAYFSTGLGQRMVYDLAAK